MSDKVCEHKEWSANPFGEGSDYRCAQCGLLMTSGEHALFLALREQVAILRELVALQKAQ